MSDTPDAEKPKAPSSATTLVRLALERFRLAVDQSDEPFAVAIDGPQVARPLRGGKDSLRNELAAIYYVINSGQHAAPQQALADACATLEGIARGQAAQTLHLRAAQHEDVIYLDLGETSGRAVRIDATGWRVVDRAPVLFRRSQLTAALPEPTAGGTLDELWHLLNVTTADRTLLLAWLVAALVPDMPHPILTIRGEQGTGKSKGSRMLAGLIDPSPAQVRKPPRDVDAWVTAATGSWVVAVDNVSDISDWWSDALCRAVTGDGDVRRTLYSNGDLSVFAFRRVILLNGIDLGAVRDDLAERLLTVELDRIPDSRRRLDAEMDAEWRQAHPRILGALLDLTVQVLAALPDVQLASMPRMADFARVLAAVDKVVGDDALSRYTGQAGDLAADAVDADPVLAAIQREIALPWHGTAADLLLLITPAVERWRAPKGWPKDARAMTGLLRRRAPTLRRLGWSVDDLGRGGKGMVVRFELTPPQVGEEGRRQAGDRQATGDEAGDSDSRRLPQDPPVTCDDVENGSEAGEAGDKTQFSPTCLFVEEEKRGTDREGPETTPALPASPASTLPNPPSVRSADLGPCLACGRPTTRYGDQGTPLCEPCAAAVWVRRTPQCDDDCATGMPPGKHRNDCAISRSARAAS